MKKYFFITALIVLCITTIYAQNNKSSDKPDSKHGENMNNILIAYFSCTGNTRSLAEQIAQVTKADLYEIKPKIPYSSADLNWRNNSSRANIENNDSSSRPEISGNAENMEKYNGKKEKVK